MRKFGGMKLATKLSLAFGLLVVLGLVGNGIALHKLAQLNNNLEDIVTDNNAKLALTNDMLDAVQTVSRVVRTIVLLDDETQKAMERKKIDEARADYNKAREALDKFPASEAGKARRVAIDAAATKARQLNTQVLELGLAKKDQEALGLLMKQAGPATAEWEAALVANLEFQKKNNTKQHEEAKADYVAAKTLLMSFALLSVVVASALAAAIVRSLVRALGGEPAEVVDAVRAVAAGDLVRPVNVKSGDTSSVVAAVAAMQTSLTQVVSSVRGNSESVATASAQIAQGNQDLSQRTEEQASALQQTAATMEQLNTATRNNADSARQANQLALSASAIAAQGGQVVSQVVSTMQGISESSRKIGDIIGVIDGIAFQTNILALNAAVEAARAGEQGRGFAVVASEVRNLAQRSAEAAKEIKTLIGRSVEQVEQGSVLVDEAGKTMGEIVGSIQRVSDIVAEISAASAEQNSGISQVGNAVNQMDQVTQQNAALVEESAAAAESLKGQAQQLVQAVSVFKLRSTARVGATVAAAPAASASAFKRLSPAGAPAIGRPAAKATPGPAAAEAAEPGRRTSATPAGADSWESF